MVLHRIKPRLQVPLERTPGCWIEELPSILWGIQTTLNRSTDFTLFFMVYGAEAIVACRNADTEGALSPPLVFGEGHGRL
jgi:hypothetical protein